MNSCLGHQHVLNVHFGSRPKWTCKVQTQRLCFCPTIFPTLVWGSAVWPISLTSFAVSTAVSTSYFVGTDLASAGSHTFHMQ